MNLQKWMAKATSAQQIALAKFAKTSRNHLYQLSAQKRKASALLAMNIERGSTKVGIGEIQRETLSDACKQCDFAKRCRKQDLEELA